MAQLFESFLVNNKQYTLETPSICPRCNTGGRPIIMSSNFYWLKYGNGMLLVIFQCFSCVQTFAVDYFYLTQDDTFSPKALYPPLNIPPDIPVEMNFLYPQFTVIYHQANVAERQSLDQIAGMAYRKALEFLIKQYLIQKHPEAKDRILSETLTQSVSRIQFSHMETLAKAATWIGNDQTHILQRHKDYGVADIKEFTKALCRYILAERTAEKAFQLTNPAILLPDQSPQ